MACRRRQRTNRAVRSGVVGVARAGVAHASTVARAVSGAGCARHRGRKHTSETKPEDTRLQHSSNRSELHSESSSSSSAYPTAQRQRPPRGPGTRQRAPSDSFGASEGGCVCARVWAAKRMRESRGAEGKVRESHYKLYESHNFVPRNSLLCACGNCWLGDWIAVIAGWAIGWRVTSEIQRGSRCQARRSQVYGRGCQACRPGQSYLQKGSFA